MCIIHPDYLTTSRHWELHRELLELLLDAPDGWRCLPQQAATWWRKRDQSQVVGDAIVGPAVEQGRVVSLSELFSV